MKISRAMKIRMGSFLAMWFAGQLSDIEALASALEQLAEEARRQATTTIG
jgi:hypothetical protein